MPAAGISALEHVRDSDGTYTSGTGGVGYSWQWWVVVFQFITLVGEFSFISHSSPCQSALITFSQSLTAAIHMALKALLCGILVSLHAIHACVQDGCPRAICPAMTVPNRSPGLKFRMLGSGVFHGASWGHHETGRVAIVAFLTISTVLLFVSSLPSTLAAWDADQKRWTGVL